MLTQTGKASVREVLTGVIASELRASRETVFMGETIRGVGASGVARGLYAEFGPDQVIETPVSENGIFGAALGLALAGFRPIVEIYSADFLLVVANEVINDMCKWRHQQRTPAALPITIRGCMGATGGLGPEHSQCMEAYFHHAPGLTIVVPATVSDAAGLLRSAIRSSDPVLFLEHRKIYDLTDDTPGDPEFVAPIGKADIVRRGSDLTIVAWAWMRHEAHMAAAELAERGISVELIDPRTIRPMDWETIRKSVDKTGRLLVVEEAPRTGGIGAEILARVAERPGKSGAAMRRLTMPDAIHPYSPELERSLLPTSSDIVRAAIELSSEVKQA
jgi:pyruvate/2-oxoglutarate/acetoin dehydrogenase E1 component